MTLYQFKKYIEQGLSRGEIILRESAVSKRSLKKLEALLDDEQLKELDRNGKTKRRDNNLKPRRCKSVQPVLLADWPATSTPSFKCNYAKLGE